MINPPDQPELVSDPYQPIPYEEIGKDKAALHFAHANGYPPGAYQQLLTCLAGDYHVYAMHMRPLWSTMPAVELRDWALFANDFKQFLEQQKLAGIIGIGHSIGGTTTLRLALSEPDRFKAIILIEPVIFPPSFTRVWKLIFRAGLAYKVHPLAKAALRRRSVFENQNQVLANYRTKSVFSRIEDRALQDYVAALVRPRPDGQLELRFSSEWESRIYITGALIDLPLWQMLPKLKPPILIIRGGHSDTFWEYTAKLVQRKLPTVELVTLPQAGHLLPLEYPEKVCTIIKQFLAAQTINTDLLPEKVHPHDIRS